MRGDPGIVTNAARPSPGRARWWCLLLPGFLAIVVAGQAATPAVPAPSPTPPSAVAAEAIPEQARAALDQLAALAPADARQSGPAASLQSLQELSERLRLLVIETGGTGDSSPLEVLRELQVSWHQLLAACKAQDTALANQARAIALADQQTREIIVRWQATERSMQGTPAADASRRLIQNVLDAADAAERRIQKTQGPLLQAQARAEQLRTQCEAGIAAVDQALDAAVNKLFVRNGLPLWEPRAREGDGAAVEHPEKLSEQGEVLVGYTSRHVERFVLHALVFLGLLTGLFALRRRLHGWAQGNQELRRALPILEVPFSTALALSFLVAGPAYFDAPTLFHALLGMAALPPMIVILRRVLDVRLRPELYALMGFFFVEQLRRLVVIFPGFDRWMFCAEMLAAALFCVHLSRAAAAAAMHWRASTYRGAALVLAAALLADAWGYVRLAELLGTGTLRSAYAGLCLYALRRILEGLVAISLRVRPLANSHVVRQHLATIQHRVLGLLRGAAILVWAVFTLEVFQLREPLAAQAHRVLGLAWRVGAIELSVGGLLGCVVAIWLSVQVARLVRFFLNEEVYERVTLAPGLPYAISTIINYLILLVGFLVALGLLGVDLTKITIVAGAFSVGLGFGLQNVINNFVSGVILLFERPVKVGDLIQIGDAVGEVRRIGIRASVVRTRDGSDIILPNGNLISNQVTNWTYSDRRGTVEVTLNVAHGPDRRRVMALLKAAAASALEKAEPEVYVTAVTAASTSFTVRAWMTYTGDDLPAHSDLSLALTEALDREQLPLA